MKGSMDNPKTRRRMRLLVGLTLLTALAAGAGAALSAFPGAGRSPSGPIATGTSRCTRSRPTAPVSRG